MHGHMNVKFIIVMVEFLLVQAMFLL
jgi:hypothetical protein